MFILFQFKSSVCFRLDATVPKTMSKTMSLVVQSRTFKGATSIGHLGGGWRWNHYGLLLDTIMDHKWTPSNTIVCSCFPYSIS